MEQRFLLPSPAYYEMQVLLRIDRAGSVSLPLDPRELPLPSLEHLPITRLIQEKILAVRETEGSQVVVLTDAGRAHMRRLVIDYHLELISLGEASDGFFRERVRALTAMGCKRVLLYGASDTARALIAFLHDSAIAVVGVIDDDPAKRGTQLGGVPVIGPADVAGLEFDTVVVTTVAFEEVILRERAARLPSGQKVVGLFESA
jgi:FlaA1/EpsC-like NDP-sugar epimerase